MEFPEHPFWNFAIEAYRRPGANAACLQLQEAYHLDVNLLLFCGWTGSCGQGRLSKDEIARCREATAAWHEQVVRGLRAVRRILKDGMGIPEDLQGLSDELRKHIQAREIDAEHVEQLILVGVVQRVPNDNLSEASRLADAAANMVAYVAALDGKFDAADRDSLAVILGAMFPESQNANDAISAALQ